MITDHFQFYFKKEIETHKSLMSMSRSSDYLFHYVEKTDNEEKKETQQ